MPFENGKVKTGGRTKGTPNYITADIKALAQKYGPEAIKTLINIMRTSENELTRIAAAKVLLDRGYGRPMQPIAAEFKHTHGLAERLNAAMAIVDAREEVGEKMVIEQAMDAG